MKKKKTNRYNSIYKIMGAPYNLIIMLLIIIPFTIMVIYSFNGGSGPFDISFTLNHYINFFSNVPYLTTMLESLYLAILTTIISLFIAYPLAYFIVKQKPKIQALMILLITSPMFINMLIQVNAIKQIMLMVAPSLEGTRFIIVIGMVYMFLPFMLLPIYNSLAKIDQNLYESSADLGANSMQTLRRVIIPLSMPGVLSGITMVFLPAATSIVVAAYLGKGQKYLIGNLIEDLIINSGRYGYGAAISIVLVLIMLGLIYLTKRANRYQGVETDAS